MKTFVEYGERQLFVDYEIEDGYIYIDHIWWDSSDVFDEYTDEEIQDISLKMKWEMASYAG